jgi:3-hydroxy-3-methylglutaryl CoA synthase
VIDKTIFMFSYGSGLIATTFAICPRVPTHSTKFTVDTIAQTVNLEHRLNLREEHTPETFQKALLLREGAHHAKLPFTPVDPMATVRYSVTP